MFRRSAFGVAGSRIHPSVRELVNLTRNAAQWLGIPRRRRDEWRERLLHPDPSRR